MRDHSDSDSDPEINPTRNLIRDLENFEPVSELISHRQPLIHGGIRQALQQPLPRSLKPLAPNALPSHRRLAFRKWTPIDDAASSDYDDDNTADLDQWEKLNGPRPAGALTREAIPELPPIPVPDGRPGPSAIPTTTDFVPWYDRENVYMGFLDPMRKNWFQTTEAGLRSRHEFFLSIASPTTNAISAQDPSFVIPWEDWVHECEIYRHAYLDALDATTKIHRLVVMDNHGNDDSSTSDDDVDSDDNVDNDDDKKYSVMAATAAPPELRAKPQPAPPIPPRRGVIPLSDVTPPPPPPIPEDGFDDILALLRRMEQEAEVQNIMNARAPPGAADNNTNNNGSRNSGNDGDIRAIPHVQFNPKNDLDKVNPEDRFIGLSRAVLSPGKYYLIIMDWLGAEHGELTVFEGDHVYCPTFRARDEISNAQRVVRRESDGIWFVEALGPIPTIFLSPDPTWQPR